MTHETLQNLIFGAAWVACGAGQFLDCQTTDAGLAHGYVEKLSLVGKITTKIGSSGYFIVKCMVIPAIGALLFGLGQFGPSLLWLGILAAQGWFVGVKNYLLLKKNNIKVF